MCKKILTFIIMICSSALSMAGGATFFYELEAEAVPDDKGKIYIYNEPVDTEKIRYRKFYGTTTFEESANVGVHAATVTAYLYAKPEEGCVFTHWSRIDDKGNEVAFSNAMNATDLITMTATEASDRQNPYLISYIAHFAQRGLVYVESSDERYGTVNIDNPTNALGDVVTLTATSDMLCGRFIGWTHNGTGDIITTNPLNITVDESTAGEYKAIFESTNMEERGLYVMVENKYKHRTLGVKGNSESTLSKDQRYFYNSMMFVERSNENLHSTPALVMKMVGIPTGAGGLKDVELISQDMSTHDISNMRLRVERFLENDYFIFGNNNGFTGYIKDNGGRSSKEELIGTITYPSVWNRPDTESTYRWSFRILDKDHMNENYFGAKPSAESLKNGKYYTTMYTSFPYECYDGVKAYIIDKYLESGMLHLKEIEGGIVPSRTPVLLECNSTNPKENRLIPLLNEPAPISDTNLLKGEIWLDDESEDPSNYRTLFDPATMRVFNHTTGTFSNVNNTDPTNNNITLKYIANNTCYLDISTIENPGDEITLTKEEGFDKLLGDANGDKIVDVTDVMVTVNRILGNTPSPFFRENADVDGNDIIDVTDVMLIVHIILN